MGTLIGQWRFANSQSGIKTSKSPSKPYLSKRYIAKPSLGKVGTSLMASKGGKANVFGVVAAVLAVAVTVLAGLVVGIYVPQINSQSGQIADQQARIAQQQHQIDALNATVDQMNQQVDDLRESLAKYTASLITELGVKDLVESNTTNHYLYVKGDVINNGVTTAYNAKLHIVGYSVNHEVLIDLYSSIGFEVHQNGFSSSSNFGSILPTQTQSAIISIYHSGTVASWDITPVWTNTP